MAREVAVDVASHSPQVDPILDELADALAGLDPVEPTVRYYSATLYDPRDEADFDAYYWVDNLRHTVRFAAAVQAAMEDGHRVFAELSPHPLLTHAVEQTARSLDVPLAVLPAMRREQELPHGLRRFRGRSAQRRSSCRFLGPVSDRAFVGCSAAGMDPPTTPGSTGRPRPGGARGRHGFGAPAVGFTCRAAGRAGRHLWQGEVGTDAQPWLSDHQVHGVAVLPAAGLLRNGVGRGQDGPG